MENSIVLIEKLITGIFLSLFMAYVIDWKLHGTSSKIWHKLGWWMRFFPAMSLILFSLGQYHRMSVYLLLYLSVVWVFWDLIINLVNKFGILYIDRKGINKTIINILIFLLTFGKKISDAKREKYSKYGDALINIAKLTTFVVSVVLTVVWWEYL